MTETVSLDEKTSDKRLGAKLPHFTKPVDVRSKFTKEIVKNFACPACGETLSEAIAYNGKVRGWCGRTGKYIGGEMSLGDWIDETEEECDFDLSLI